MRYHLPFAILITTAVAANSPIEAEAQQQPVSKWAPAELAPEDYARAERYLAQFTNPLVVGGVVRPTWLPDGRFWYGSQGAGGEEFVLVDPATRGQTRNATLAGLGVAAAPEAESGNRNESVSPDGRTAVFIREHNLWARDVASGRETQLTTDGVEDFGYGTNNAGWTRSAAPVVVWSPDSRRIATFQHDGRGVSEMALVSTTAGEPTLDRWKYPLPGDSVIFRITRVIIDLNGPRLIRLQMPPDPHRSTLCDHVVCRGGGWVDVKWSNDSRQLAFASVSRDHKDVTLRIAHAEMGAVRDILHESVPTYFESGNGRVNWHVLPESNEVIWFSERDDWGHLYLYDLRTGRLKNRITEGGGNVMQVLRVDEQQRRIWFIGLGREQGRDPYFRHLYSVDFDGSGLRLLTPEDADHDVSLSPDGRFFVDNYSRPDVPVRSVLRAANGDLVLELERMDISALLATGWTPPIPFTVKARDGKTDLYGLMYRPSGFDSTKAYPIINNIYPGPQTGSVRSRSFAASRSDTRALAELGFIVIQLDGMGTPGRSKSFHDAWYGNMGDNTLPDQVTAMQQLAARHRWIDIDRAGIYGHSGGGNATVAAMLQYPDFFKVGVAQAGNHDNRIYEDDWAEKWQGLLVRNPDGTTNYDNQANQLRAENLKGKLLLAHGTLDTNVPPYSTLLVVDALIKHNKDFDLIMFPNRPHGFGNEPYMIRRRWDYFVEHLLGAQPPEGYRIGDVTS